MRRLQLVPAWCILAMFTSGCADSIQQHDWSSQDSSGVAITQVSPPAGTPFSLSLVVSIGLSDGSDEYLFMDLRGVWLTDHGTLVAVDAGRREIRSYSLDGQFVRSAGGAGEGPGEFRALNGPWQVTDDLLAVYDWQSQRVSFVDPAGNITTSKNITAAPGFSPVGFQNDSVIVGVVYDPAPTRSGAGLEDVYVELKGVTWDGATTFRVGPIVDGERIIVPRGQSLLISSPPEARSTQYAVRGDNIVIGTQRTPSLFIYSEGKLTEILHVPIQHNRTPPPPVDAETAALLRDAPKRVLYHGAMLFDAAGRIWLRTFDEPNPGLHVWLVLDHQASKTNTAELPAGYQPMHITDDYIAGVHTDSLGVQSIQVYRWGIDKQ